MQRTIRLEVSTNAHLNANTQEGAGMSAESSSKDGAERSSAQKIENGVLETNTEWPLTEEMKIQQYSIRTFARDIITVLDKFNGDMVQAAAVARPIVEQFIGNSSLAEFGVHRQGNHVPRSVWLYYDYELEVALSAPAPNVSLPVHNHGTWEFVAPYRGEMSYVSYRDITRKAEEGVAELEVVEERILRPGDAAVVGPPNDIHKWTPRGDDFLLLNMNHGPLAARRRYYNIDAKSYVVHEPAHWRASVLGR
jgi:predicted metal-dependent enzyme (double-stranded beta helix superfamily)